MLYSMFEMRTRTDSLLGPSCPFKSWVITAVIVITACFLKGQASQGSNPPVSTHINGLIGLFTFSQNPGRRVTEMLSPQSPSRLNTREMHDVSAKWSHHCAALSNSHRCHSCVTFFPLFCFVQSCGVCIISRHEDLVCFCL